MSDALKTRLQLLLIEAKHMSTEADEAAWLEKVAEAFEDEGWVKPSAELA